AVALRGGLGALGVRLGGRPPPPAGLRRARCRPRPGRRHEGNDAIAPRGLRVLAEGEIQVAPNVLAKVVVRRSKEPLSQGFSRATRRGGLVIRSGCAAHETTLAGFEGRPGTRHLYGEVYCEAIEQLQRAALDRPRPELVVKVDRSGLNEHHPI